MPYDSAGSVQGLRSHSDDRQLPHFFRYLLVQCYVFLTTSLLPLSVSSGTISMTPQSSHIHWRVVRVLKMALVEFSTGEVLGLSLSVKVSSDLETSPQSSFSAIVSAKESFAFPLPLVHAVWA